MKKEEHSSLQTWREPIGKIEVGYPQQNDVQTAKLPLGEMEDRELPGFHPDFSLTSPRGLVRLILSMGLTKQGTNTQSTTTEPSVLYIRFKFFITVGIPKSNLEIRTTVGFAVWIRGWLIQVWEPTVVDPVTFGLESKTDSDLNRKWLSACCPEPKVVST